MAPKERTSIKGTEADTKEPGPSRNARRLAVAATGIAAALVTVMFSGHPASTAITIGGFIVFLLAFRLADPSGSTA
jgi:hypothetical protein